MFSLFLIILAALFNSVMDTLKFRFERSIFNRPGWWRRFCGPQSWRNKWKIILPPKERFLFSSTFLVFLTDGWHFAQFVMLKAFMLAVVLYKPLVVWWADFIIFSIVYGLTFELFFSKIWKQKK